MILGLTEWFKSIWPMICDWDYLFVICYH